MILTTNLNFLLLISLYLNPVVVSVSMYIVASLVL